MIYVVIIVAKDKHACFIANSDGEVLFKSFTIPNNRDSFENLFQKVQSASDDLTKVNLGLEASRHYNYNLLGFLLDKSLSTYIVNPLHAKLYRKSLSLRKTKTNKVDVHAMLSKFSSAKHIANAHLTRLSNLLSEVSKSRYGNETAIAFREVERTSIGSNMPRKSLELKHPSSTFRNSHLRLMKLKMRSKSLWIKSILLFLASPESNIVCEL